MYLPRVKPTPQYSWFGLWCHKPDIGECSLTILHYAAGVYFSKYEVVWGFLVCFSFEVWLNCSTDTVQPQLSCRHSWDVDICIASNTVVVTLGLSLYVCLSCFYCAWAMYIRGCGLHFSICLLPKPTLKGAISMAAYPHCRALDNFFTCTVKIPV